jgi:hypothetical protein
MLLDLIILAETRLHTKCFFFCGNGVYFGLSALLH